MAAQKFTWLVCMLLGVAILYACAVDQVGPGTDNSTAETSPTPLLQLATTLPPPTGTVNRQPAPEKEKTTMPDVPTSSPLDNPYVVGLIDAAKTDLAQRLDIQLEEIELVEFRVMTWPDASLGCPQPDMGYLQVTQEGYLIILKAGKGVYNYHGGGSPDRGPFLCEE